jgi:hypothetical protein
MPKRGVSPTHHGVPHPGSRTMERRIFKTIQGDSAENHGSEAGASQIPKAVSPILLT